MKKCLSCNTLFTSLESHCHDCGWAPDIMHGLKAYSPKQVPQKKLNPKKAHFAELASFEANHFWFRARNELIIWALKKYCLEFQSFLEIGCGTGRVLSSIAKAFPGREYSGSDLLIDSLDFTEKKQNISLEFMQMDARNIPFVEEFDCIGAFNVLEHIQEDERVLQQIHQALKPDGMVFLIVSRPYSLKKLGYRIQEAGFEIVRATSFVVSLLPWIWISGFIKMKEFRLPAFMNSLFAKILEKEIYCIRRGMNFFVGGARLVVARKE